MDGFDDFAIGIPNSGAGSVNVYSGQDGDVLFEIQDNGRGFFGHSISSLSDINGDGLSDLIVSSAFGSNRGEVFVFTSQIQAVPEPSSLLGLPVILLAWSFRRKRSA